MLRLQRQRVTLRFSLPAKWFYRVHDTNTSSQFLHGRPCPHVDDEVSPSPQTKLGISRNFLSSSTIPAKPRLRSNTWTQRSVTVHFSDCMPRVFSPLHMLCMVLRLVYFQPSGQHNLPDLQLRRERDSTSGFGRFCEVRKKRFFLARFKTVLFENKFQSTSYQE